MKANSLDKQFKQMEKDWNNHIRSMASQQPEKLKDGDKDWKTPCDVCDSLPTVHPTDLCGPCCFGEADTIMGNW